MKTSWNREIANVIWLKIKGTPIPDYYTEKDCADVLQKYWHKALESEQ